MAMRKVVAPEKVKKHRRSGSSAEKMGRIPLKLAEGLRC